MSPLHSRAAEQVAAFEAERKARARAGVPPNPPPLPGSRAFSLDEVGPGWRLWSDQRRTADAAEMELQSALGGVCVERMEADRVDDETGEVWHETRFRCCTWLKVQPWVTLRAGEIALDQLGGLDRAASANAARWLLAEIGTNRRGLFTRDEKRRIHDAYRLACAVEL